MFRGKNFHFDLLHLRCDAVLSGVPENQSLFDCPLEGTVEHQMDAADSCATEPGISLAAFPVDPAIFQQILVELLQVPTGELF